MNEEKIKALEELVKKEYGNIGGIVVLKNGEKAYEQYFGGFSEDTAFHVYSVTKSIFSVLLGIAIDKGLIGGTDDRILDFFPEYTLKRGEKTAPLVTIKDMITMTTPFKYKSAPYTKYFTSESWVKTALDLLGGKGKIGEFRYTPLIGPDILSGVLTSASGKSALQFAKENLFNVLGIDISENITFETKEDQLEITKYGHKPGWVADPQGINTTGWGLFIKTADMAKIGELYRRHGNWNGKQVVSENWVLESTTEHSRWGEIPYGYLWWLTSCEYRGYAAMGDCGNIIYVNEKNGMVVAVASGYKPLCKDRLELIQKHIEPLFAEG